MPSVHNNGSGNSEPDPQVALNAAAIAQNELIAKMDTLQAGETIAEAGEIHAYGGRQWVSLSDNVEVPDPVSIAILEASDDFEELTIPRSRYRRLFPDAISSDFTSWDNPDELTLVLVLADGDTEIIYGRFNAPQTLTIPDLRARLFQFEGGGWFPVVPEVVETECLNLIAGPTNNPGQLDAPTFRTVGSFIVQEAGTFGFRHSGQDVVGTAGIGFSRTPFPSNSTATTISQGNLHGSSAAQRLTADKQTEDFQVTFAASESYPLEVHVGFFSGGGSSAESQRLDRIQSVAVPTTGFAVTTGATAGGFLTLGGSGQQGGSATTTATPATVGVSSELSFSYFLNSDRIGDGLPVLAEVVSAGGIVLGSLEVETDIAAPTIARVPFVPITGDVTIRFTDTAINNDGSNRDLRISNVSLITIGNEKVSIGDDGLPDVVELPEPVDFTTAFEGVIVDAAPAWTDGLVTLNGAANIRSINSGVDLNNVDKLIVHIKRNNETWTAPTFEVRLDKFVFDDDRGALLEHFDNQFVALRINTNDKSDGIIQAYSSGTNTTFDLQIDCIEFKKRVVGVSNRVGMREWGPSGRTPEEGYLAMTGVVANGAVDYPIAAQRNPLFVSGNDFDFTKYEGAFARNLGGNAADEGVLQQDQQERSPNNPVGTQVNGGGGNTVRSVTTANETRPVNVAEQLYLIVDTYLEANAASTGPPTEDSEVTIFPRTEVTPVNGSALGLTLSGSPYDDWDKVFAEFESVRVIIHAGVPTRNSFYDRTISIEDLVLGTAEVLLYLTGTITGSSVLLRAILAGGNTFRYQNQVSTGVVHLELRGVRKQQAVIDPSLLPAETLNNAVAITSLQIEAPATGDQLPFETFTLLSGSITSNTDRTAFTLPQSDIPYVVKGTAGVDLDGNPGTSNWSIELWDIEAGARLPGSTNATASVFAVTGTQSGYQFYQPDMMAIVDASAGPITIGMVLAESSTGSGGNTLDILDRTLEIYQKPTHVAPAVTDAPRQFNLRSDIPSPTTFVGGDVLTVSNDPVAVNNGSYLVLGAVGQPGTSIIPN